MKGICLSISDLLESQKSAMFELLCLCFVEVERTVFDKDIQEKDRVVLLYKDNLLVGFSTFTLRPEIDIENRSASILCSGDTIIDPKHWGSSALGRTLIQSAWELHQQSKRESFWWLLITSGPRTWGVLPTFFKNFYPHPNHPKNSVVTEWTRKLCEARWPGRQDSATEIIRLLHPQKLRPPLDTIPTSRSLNNGVRWYVSINSGWCNGDELPSVVQIHPSNLTRAGWRYLSDYIKGQ